MKSLGIRVTTAKIFYSIYDSTSKEITSDKLILSESLDLPNNLKIIRAKFLEIINTNKIDITGIKTADNNGLSVSIPRICIEGVLQEVFASSELKSYSIFSLKEVSQALGIKSKEYKPLTTDADLFSTVIENHVGNNSFKTNTETREAILVAIAAHNKAV